MTLLPDGVLHNPPDRLETDVVVIGSGPGGAVTGGLLAEAGRNVLMLEDGAYLPLDPATAFTRTEMLQKYRNGGVTVAMGKTKVAYVEGRCVGGGSEINSGLYHRTPESVLETWKRDYRLEGLDELETHFEACERDVSVSYLPGPAAAPSLKLHEGATRLGWKSLEVPRWYKYPSAGDSAVDTGEERQTMSRTFVPRLLGAGGQLLPLTRVDRLRRQGGSWSVSAVHRGNGAARMIDIRAKTVFVSCGAIQTPLLLRRSGISKNVGNQLQLHPTVKVVARFPEEINALSTGVPVHQVKEFSPRISFGCSISYPPYIALAMADHPLHAQRTVDAWRHVAIYYAMISGQGRGSVRGLPLFRDAVVKYRLTPQDYVDLSEGLKNLCRLLLAAGAEELFCSVVGTPPLRSEADVAALPDALPAGRTNLMTIHLFSSCPMGEDRNRCATDSFGRVYGAEGLHVADASLLCTSTSVNPQGSVMAFARRNAEHFLRSA